jgi:apolipoprotein D and lipocalin family protein
MIKNLSLVLVGILIMLSCKAQSQMIDNSVVKDFEVERYLGKWYEIARYNHRFERGLVGVTATYSLRDNGMINVENAGFKGSLDGKRSVATGKAKIPDMSVPSKLKVSFFLFFYGDYFVMELDSNYQWAVVGSSSENYLWILSRTPEMDEDIYNDLIDRLINRGYDVDKLIRVEQ